MRGSSLLPPILLAALRRLSRRSGRRRFASYGEALHASSRDGYENHDLVEVVIRKTRRLRDELASDRQPARIDPSSGAGLVALLTTAEGSGAIRVLDFGGAAGAHYLLARALLPSSRELRWAVVETEAMAKAAAEQLATHELSFHGDLQTAVDRLEQVDLLHSSGTLQCVEDPYTCLERLVAVGAKQLLLNRLGLSRSDHDVITVHETMLSWNGPGPMPEGISDRRICYPFTFPQEGRLKEILAGGYRVRAEFEDSSGCFPVDNEPIFGLGLLLERLETPQP